jgi:hypothetical protein
MDKEDIGTNDKVQDADFPDTRADLSIENETSNA